VSAYDDDVDADELMISILGVAAEKYKTLPEVSDEETEAMMAFNDSPDPEPEFQQHPSGDDEQVLTCGMSLRVNGFEVLNQGASTIPVPFDEIPMVAANLIGVMAAHGLLSTVTPASMIEREDDAIEQFKEAWSRNMPIAKMKRHSAMAAAHQRRVEKFLRGELKEDN
jgi:hypothetical protein